jgi:hypothetical protein
VLIAVTALGFNLGVAFQNIADKVKTWF